MRLSSSSFSLYCCSVRISSATTLVVTCVRIFLAWLANLSVESVSETNCGDGVAQHTTAVRQLPTREDCSSLVSCEPRKLIKPSCDLVAKSLMTRLSVSRERLMLLPSLSLMPSACVSRTLSEPAKSTSDSRPRTAGSVGPALLDTCSVSSVCERDERAFTSVLPTCRRDSPL